MLPARRRRPGTVIRAAAASLAAALIFVGMMPIAVLVHADTAAMRQLVVAAANRAMVDAFRGQVEVQSVSRVGLRGFDGAAAVVRDDQGRVVSVVEGVDVRVALAALARAALRRAGEIPVVLTRVDIRHLDVTLVRGADGRPTLAHALEPRHPSPDGAPSRSIRLDVRTLRVESASVQGALGAIDRIDASLSALDASLTHDERATNAHVRRVFFQLSGVAPRPIRATMGADLSLPAHGEPRANTTVEGSVGDVPISADGSLRGRHVDARLDVQATPDGLRTLVPSLALESPASVHAEIHGWLSSVRASLRVRGADGTLDADAGGGLDPNNKTVEGWLAVRLSEGRIGGQVVGLAVARADIEGALASPRGRLTLRAERVRAVGRTFDHVAIDADGPLREPVVAVSLEGPDLPDVRARATLGLGDGIEAHAATVVLSRPAWRMEARVARVHAVAGALDATGIEVLSGGDRLRGEAHVRRQSVALRFRTAGMDVTPLLQVAGTRLLTRGRIALDLDVRGNRDHATGHVIAALEATGPPNDAPRRARVVLRLAGRRIDGEAQVAVENASARATLTQIALGGPLVDEHSWRTATGTIDVDSDAPLETLRRMLPDDAVPFEEVAGALQLRVHIARRDAEGPPDAVLGASTRGLVLVASPPRARHPASEEEREEAEALQPPWRLRGVDVNVVASLDGASNRVVLEGELADRLGPLARLDAEAQPEWWKIVRAPEAARALLEQTPVKLRLAAPERDISTLPTGLRPSALRGRFEVTADLHGSIVDPRVLVQLRARALQTTPWASAMPFDGTAEASYDGHAILARALLSRPEGVVLDARSDVDVRVADLLHPPPEGLPWDAGATVALHAFPLQGVLPREARGVGGVASGVVELEGLHRDARIDADLQVEQPRLGVVCFQDGWVRVRADGRRLAASAGVERPGSRLSATIGAGASWASSLAPAIDASHPIELALEATNFRVSSFLPFVGDSVNQLDGRIDADARLRVGPDFKSGTMEGDVRLTGGVVEVPALGELLHDVTARVSMRPWGTLRFDGITARASTGRVSASAQVLLDGLEVRGATADLDIPGDQRIPLTVEGVSFGEASGRVHADATMSADQRVLDVRLTVPRLDVRLPQTAAHTLQSLDPAPHVAIGMFEPDGRFVTLPMHSPRKPRAADSIELRGVLDLGGDVRIRRDANLELELTGSPAIELTDELRLNGTVHLTRGYIDVFGKRFAIDPASTIAFAGDTSNPQLIITAQYDARDGTRIFADVVGPMKKPRISLRSEPARSQDAIAGLLLFGSEEGLAGAPGPSEQPDPTQRAAGVVSGPIAEALNKALSGITSLDVTARLDTSQAANPRPEVEVRLTNEVLARVTVQTGMPAPGEPPDRTLLSVDWRFHPRWSLESTVGDEGSTFIDLLWHHRY
jgi:translocation and assembly module TamB